MSDLYTLTLKVKGEKIKHTQQSCHKVNIFFINPVYETEEIKKRKFYWLAHAQRGRTQVWFWL